MGKCNMPFRVSHVLFVHGRTSASPQQLPPPSLTTPIMIVTQPLVKTWGWPLARLKDCRLATVVALQVDVWGAAVVFYQMLYGRKPFGNDVSQQQLVQNRIILNARSVEFPAKPQVSPETKVCL